MLDQSMQFTKYDENCQASKDCSQGGQLCCADQIAFNAMDISASVLVLFMFDRKKR